MKRLLKRIWDYFFSKNYSDPPIVDIPIEQKYDRYEVKFFDPITTADKFKKSKTLKDFIHTIDHE